MIDRNPYPHALPNPAPEADADPQGVRGYRPIHPEGTLRRRLRRLWAPVAVVVGLGVKLKGALLVLLKLKFLGTSASMLVSVAGYALLWGWRFALGFVLLLFVHELGHVAEARRQGLKTGGVYFIPFLGAVMLLKQPSKSAAHAAWLGLAGPVLGGAAAAAAWMVGLATGSELWVALGFTGFLLNLFNLIPVMPLDGGWATAVFHPLFWLFGLAGLVALFIAFPSPIILIVAALGAFELWKRWRSGPADGTADRAVSGRQRVAIAAVYLSLAALLALGMSASHQKRNADGTRAAVVAAPHAGPAAIPRSPA